MKTIWNNFKVAFAMYSKIPMPPADWEKENMKYALCFFPWVGLAVGAVSAVLFWLLQQIGAGSMLRAAVLTAVPVLVTGGIHLDGYLDTMDALSSWREKQRRLEILKDPHAGAFAIIMGCLYFVLYAGAAGEAVGVGIACGQPCCMGAAGATALPTPAKSDAAEAPPDSGSPSRVFITLPSPQPTPRLPAVLKG